MSAILKGLMSETGNGEEVHTVYIDGKPSVKYINRGDAERAIKIMQAKHPGKKFEIKQEVREDEFFVRNNSNDNKPEPMQFRIKGGGGAYSLENLKKKAIGEAKQLVADLEAGKFIPSAYNIKQLANTIDTVADVLRELNSKSKQDNLNLDEARDTPGSLKKYEIIISPEEYNALKADRLGMWQHKYRPADGSLIIYSKNPDQLYSYLDKHLDFINTKTDVVDMMKSGLKEAGATKGRYLATSKDGVEKAFMNMDSSYHAWKDSTQKKKSQRPEREMSLVSPADRRLERQEAENRDVAQLYDVMQSAPGECFPDGDPTDTVLNFINKKRWDSNKTNRIMSKALKMLGRKYKSYTDYLADFWDDVAPDHAELVGGQENPWRDTTLGIKKNVDVDGIWGIDETAFPGEPASERVAINVWQDKDPLGNREWFWTRAINGHIVASGSSHSEEEARTKASKSMSEGQEGREGSGRFAAEKTATVNPYGGQKDRQFRGSISESRKTSSRSHIMQGLTNHLKK